MSGNFPYAPTKSSASVPLSRVIYNPGTVAVSKAAPAGSLAAVDTANLTISFTPTTANVVVILKGLAVAISGELIWGVATHGTLTVRGVLAEACANIRGNFSVEIPISGLTPGVAVQLDWIHGTTATGSLLVVGGTTYAQATASGGSVAIMEVWSA